MRTAAPTRHSNQRLHAVGTANGLGVERAAATGPEPLHEAIADQSGVAHGLPDPRFIVDLDRQQ
jgi:hypothetical protein